MHETYEYRVIRIKPRRWPTVIRRLTTIGAEAVQRFTDIEGSTRLLQELGGAAEVLSP